MNPLYQSLVQLQQRLTTADIASAVIGGIAVSVWARPRATQDIDFKSTINTCCIGCVYWNKPSMIQPWLRLINVCAASKQN